MKEIKIKKIHWDATAHSSVNKRWLNLHFVFEIGCCIISLYIRNSDEQFFNAYTNGDAENRTE